MSGVGQGRRGFVEIKKTPSSKLAPSSKPNSMAFLRQDSIYRRYAPNAQVESCDSPSKLTDKISKVQYTN